MIDEMVVLVGKVVVEYVGDFVILWVFVECGDNWLYIIVGNYDLILCYVVIWELFGVVLNVVSGCINFVIDGVWVFVDGCILVEYGNQIGQDVNKYVIWLKILCYVEGKDYIVWLWGELFVQWLFNEQELIYLIIDNFSFEIVGVWYCVVDCGLWGLVFDLV